MITQVNGGITTHMDPDSGGQVHWPEHLISPQGWKSLSMLGGRVLELV